MGRKSNLNDEQWAEIGKRLLEGETPSALARELTAQGQKVTESTIRSHFERKGQKTATIQKVAGMLFDADAAAKAADEALKTLPPPAQASAIILANKMRAISESLACAAENSAKSAHRLAALANDQLQKVDDADPMKDTTALKAHVALQEAANRAATLPTSLLAANRDYVKRLNEEPPPAPGDLLTPERMTDGARRIAFTLARAAAQETR